MCILNCSKNALSVRFRTAGLRTPIQPTASLKCALEIGFNDDGKQVMPVPARIGGRAEGLNALLKTCGWEAVSNDDQWILMTICTC